MLPYPSGEPHVGHLKNYAIGDAIAHFRRRRGFDVIHPMGYDAFGLPAENNAIRTGEHPAEATRKSIESFREQFKRWGISIDWSREVSSADPDYYRWTQWLFLRFFEQGLAYRSEAPVQWCPVDATVLANEQVIDGRCERCGSLVEQKKLEQWFFKITDYADRLLDDFEILESWPDHVVTMQRNWIGRSEGAEVIFTCEEVGIDFPVFTTRPDTLFGATFFVLAPEHPDLDALAAGSENEEAVRAYVAEAARKSTEDRAAEDREKTGVRLGRTVTNPVNGEEIPMLVADYVLMDYGTGAIMAVPAHDERDFDVRQGIRPAHPPGRGARGRGDLTRRAIRLALGRRAARQLRRVRRHDLARGKEGDHRDAREGRARQAHRQLSPSRLAPLAPALLGLPDPGRPLRQVRHRRRPRRPAAGRAPRRHRLRAQGQVAARSASTSGSTPPAPPASGPARRETDTMDTFVDSSWYFIRYLDAHNAEAPWDREAADHWMAVDQYIGGVEHAILHLMYARFFVKALADMDMIGVQEPFTNLFTQGMITRERREDVQDEGQRRQPERLRRPLRRRHSAHLHLLHRTARARRRLDRRGRRGSLPLPLPPLAPRAGSRRKPSRPWNRRSRALLRKAHWAIDKVTRDITTDFALHTAIAAVMELVNDAYRLKDDLYGSPEGDAAVRFATATAASLDLPVRAAPWRRALRVARGHARVGGALARGRSGDAHLGDDLARRPGERQAPRPDRGRRRHSARTSSSASHATSEAVAKHLDGKEIVKEIVVPGRLVNLVVR